jgi:hypothetical protein
LESVSSEDGRGDHQLAHHLWMLDSDLYGDTCANAIAEEVGTLDPDV